MRSPSLPRLSNKVAGTSAAKVPATLFACLVAGFFAIACPQRLYGAESVLYRLFLMDGTTLISYGEFSRVADRVVLSIPLGATEEAPALELVSIPEASVDWDRTDRYSEAVRAKRYAETRGENDFAGLSYRVSEALNQIALTSDPARRLAMAVEARGNLARWPAENFGYRATDVAQLVGLLDEVISELRVAAGQSSFDLSLVANVTPTAPAELLPTPSFRDTMEQAVAAAAVTTEPAERVSLLRAVATALHDPALTGGWAAALNARVSSELAAELRIDKSYGDLASSTIATATARAARGDVTGVQLLVPVVLKADDRLGRRRPRETAALLALLDLRLDEARRLRLAQDAWIVRQELFRTYRATISAALVEMRRLTPSLESIRQLSGPAPGLLPRLEQRLVMAKQQWAAITPPPELQSAHDLFAAAFQMARRAVSGRRNAVLSGDMKLAWEASSAAAGAQMLLERAGQELDRLTTPPSNR
jgi:hypothetical protein